MGLVGQLKVVLFLARLDWFAYVFLFVTLHPCGDNLCLRIDAR